MKSKIGAQLDQDVLRRAVEQVITMDLTQQHGWKEGTGYHLGLPEMKPDMQAGEGLVRRGVLTRDEHGTLRLSESALIRALRVAVDKSVEDLLNNDPPEEKLPETPYYDNGPERLISLDGKLAVHEWNS